MQLYFRGWGASPSSYPEHIFKQFHQKASGLADSSQQVIGITQVRPGSVNRADELSSGTSVGQMCLGKPLCG